MNPRLALAALLLCAAACGRTTPGSFDVHFTWGSAGKPTDFSGWVVMRVEQRLGDPNTAGQVLGTVGPVPFAAGSPLSFSQIPNGSHLVVVAELRDGESTDAQVLYYGLSELFTLAAGKKIEVPVRLLLSPPPTATVVSAGGAVSSVVSIASTNGVVSSPNVTLQLLSNTGVTAHISNDVGFADAASQTLTLANLQAGNTLRGYVPYTAPWNLQLGSNLGCDTASGCSRTVYVQLVDGAGYQSGTASASVVLDNIPPGLLSGATVVSPVDADAAAPISVTLVANEPLATLPLITVQGTGGLFGNVSAEGNTTFSFVSDAPAGSAWPDGTYTVEAELLDAVGNTNTVTVGSFTVDSTPPGVVPAATQLSALSLKIGANLTFSFEVTEALATEPIVSIGSLTLTSCQATPNQPLVYTCTHQADTSEGDGVKPITVQLRDNAGNLGTSSLGSVTYDVTPPGLAFQQIAPALAICQGSVVVTLTFSEPLNGQPTLTVNPALPGAQGLVYVPSSSTTTFDYTYATPSSGSDANYVLSVVATDVAGNTSAVLPLGTLDLQLNGPTISGAAVTPTHLNLQDITAAQPVSVTFNVSEAMRAGYPQVTVGSAGASCSASGLSYTCTYAASTQPDGAQGVGIAVMDADGNTSSDNSLAVTYDLTPPTGTLLLEPSIAGSSANLTITYQASEALAATPTLTITLPDASNGNSFFGAPTINGTSYVWRHALGPTDQNGSWAVAISQVSDLAGNPGTDANSVFAVDQALPNVTASSVTPLAAKAGTVVTVSFTTNKAQAAGYPVLTVGNANVTATLGGTNAYTGSYTAAAGNDGIKPVQVTLGDAAGNVNQVSLGAVTVDTSVAPGTLTVNPSLAGQGSTITVQYVAGEPLAGPPSLSVTLPGGSSGTTLFGSVAAAPPAYTWSYALQPGDSSGTWQYTLGGLQDVVGNTASPVVLSNQVDTIDPVVTGVTNLTPSRAMNGTEIWVTFEVSKPLAVPPQVSIGSGAMTLTNMTGTTYTYAHSVSSSEGEGAMGLSATLTDLAGNIAASNLGTVVYDFTPPGVAAAVVGYTPSTTNPVPTPNAATVGTQITVSVAATEALDTTLVPSLVVRSGTSNLAFTTAAVNGTEIVFMATVPGGLGDGNYIPAISWRDVAGNMTTAATFGSPPVVLNTSVPPIASINPNLLKHLRLPQGALQNGYVTGQYVVDATLPPSTSPTTQPLPSAAFVQPSGEPLAQVRVYSAQIGGVLIGQSFFSAGAWTPTTVFANDSSAAWVTAVDTAGNESGRVQITSTEWVASTNGLSPGNSSANPHRFEARTLDWQTLEQIDYTLLGDSNGIGMPGDGNTFTSASGAFWRREATAGPTTSGPMVSDSTHGFTYVFMDDTSGDYGGGLPSSFQSFWMLANHTWAPIQAADTEFDGYPTPSTLYVPALTYDIARDRVVLYLLTDGQQSQTWEFDGTSWLNMAPATVPSPRSAARLVYDSTDEVSLLFGGQSPGGTYLNDVWAWNGNTWTPRPTNPGPSPRMAVGMAYDANRSVLVVQGGVGAVGNCDGSGSTTCSGTWELAGNTWTATDTAMPCAYPGMAYDTARRKVVLYGGQNGSGVACSSNVWEYDGSGWRVINPADPEADGNAPTSTFAQGQLVYDVRMQEVLMVAPGLSTTSGDGTLWGWQGTSWESLTPTQSVSVNPWTTVYNPQTRQQMISDDGLSGWNGSTFDTWDNDPDNSFGYAGPDTLVWDSNKSVMLTLASGNPNIFTWTPEAHYTMPAAANQPGNNRWGATVVYDPVRQVTLVLGGYEGPSYIYTYNYTFFWEWDGSTWTQRCDGSPPSDTCPALPSGLAGFVGTFDPNLGIPLFWGGSNGNATGNCNNQSKLCTELWTWNGTAWTLLSNATVVGDGGGPYAALGMFFEPELNQACATFYYGTTACWTGSTWDIQPLLDPFKTGAFYAQTAVVYSPAVRAALSQGSGWDNGLTHVPSHLFRVDLSTLGLALGEVPTWENLAVSWWAGAQGTAYQPRRPLRILEPPQTVGSPYTFTTSNTPTLALLDGIDGSTRLRISVSGTMNGASWTQVCVSGTGVMGAPVCATPSVSQGGSTMWIDTLLPRLGTAGVPLSDLSITFTESGGSIGNTTIEVIAESVVLGAETTASIYAFDPRGWQQETSNNAGPGTGPIQWSTSSSADIARMIIGGQYLYLKAQPSQSGSIVTDATEVRLNYSVGP